MPIVNLTALAISTLVILRSTNVFELPFLTTYFYHLIFLFAFFFLALIDFKKIKINLSWLPFYIISIISIVAGDPDSIFRPWERYFSFCMITFAIGPLIESPALIQFRKKTYTCVFTLVSAACVLSFFLWVAQSPFAFHENSPLLRGIFGQSMTLSPLAALVILHAMRKIFSLDVSGKKRMFLFAIAMISFFTLLISASRAAFLAFIGAVISFLFIIYRGKKKSLAICTGSILLATIISFPLWNPYLENMEKKMERDKISKSGDPLGSRKSLWEARINDFKTSPLLGSGFASMDLSNPNQKLDRKTGNVEPGNGWLFLLSSTGTLGFFSLILPIISILILLYQRNGALKLQTACIFSSILFFSIHSMAEGYLLSSGSILFMMLWLHLFHGWHLSRCDADSSSSMK